MAGKQDDLRNRLATALGQHGLILRGGFRPEPADGLPDGTGTVLLVGNAGSAMWRSFSAARAAAAGPSRDPLDRWTEAVLTPLAATFGARVLLPFGGPPYWPFQRWAQRADDVHRSPLGLLIHPTFGLWHAYRGALLFERRLPLPALARTVSPCASCVARPCLATCPVGAFTPAGYAVERCREHVRYDPDQSCAGAGCQARAACPVGREFVYGEAQAAFHMAAFIGAAAS